jgi:hypothetical protein
MKKSCLAFLLSLTCVASLASGAEKVVTAAPAQVLPTPTLSAIPWLSDPDKAEACTIVTPKPSPESVWCGCFYDEDCGQSNLCAVYFCAGSEPPYGAGCCRCA